jgi:YD repeat-containing protein
MSHSKTPELLIRSYRLIVVIIVSPILLFSQATSDADNILEVINRIPKHSGSEIDQHFRFSTITQPHTREELTRLKIRTITICIDNSWAYTGNEKGCISFIYDPNGNLISAIYSDSTGKTILNYNCSNRYDKKNNLIETKITTVPLKTESITRYSYDSLDRLVAKSFRKNEIKSLERLNKKSDETPELITDDAYQPYDQSDLGSFQEKYEYNDRNKLIKYLLSRGNITETQTFIYDSSGRVSSSKRSVIEKIYYKYTPHDMTEQHWADSSKEQIITVQYSYNSKGQLSVIKTEKDDLFKSKTYYTYTSTGNFSETFEMIPDSTSFIRNLYFYDDSGKKVKVERWTNNTLHSSYLYTYLPDAKFIVQREAILSVLGYTESQRKFDNGKKLILEQGTYIGHTSGNTKIYQNRFRKSLKYEYFQE